jgi:hypothetical protein
MLGQKETNNVYDELKSIEKEEDTSFNESHWMEELLD